MKRKRNEMAHHTYCNFDLAFEKVEPQQV